MRRGRAFGRIGLITPLPTVALAFPLFRILESWYSLAMGDHCGSDVRTEFEMLVLLKLENIERTILHMSTTAVTRDQFDAGLQALISAEAARDAAVTTALNDLIAKVDAGTVTTPEDFSAELAQITTLQTNAAAITATATADDPGPTTVPTAPVDGTAAQTDPTSGITG
jgi:hypothetical protein